MVFYCQPHKVNTLYFCFFRSLILPVQIRKKGLSPCEKAALAAGYLSPDLSSSKSSPDLSPNSQIGLSPCQKAALAREAQAAGNGSPALSKSSGNGSPDLSPNSQIGLSPCQKAALAAGRPTRCGGNSRTSCGSNRPVPQPVRTRPVDSKRAKEQERISICI